MDDDLKQSLRDAITGALDPLAVIQSLRALLHDLSPNHDQPVDDVQWIPLDKVHPNDYNPNSVARIELGLLLTSIDHDGYTQPVVTVYDPEQDRYIIVDGFHRYFVMRQNAVIRERCHGLLPCVVLTKDLNERMASTVRHNRARGKHSVQGLSNLVFQMLQNGVPDEQICGELGMEPEELLRLKHITGFSKLFKDHTYSRAWVTKTQIDVRLDYEQRTGEKMPV